jgi:Holliday junction resolvasome RuvABC endonuclease subunit
MSSNYENSHIRVLALDPTSRSFGFAVLEGPDSLIDWGVVKVKKNDLWEGMRLQRVAELIGRYQPEIIVLEKYPQEKSIRSPKAIDFIWRVAEMARARNLEVREFTKDEIRKTFSISGEVTKYQIAGRIANIFTELGARLPPPRRIWMSEDYRMGIFDAVALGLAFFYSIEKEKQPSIP